MNPTTSINTERQLPIYGSYEEAMVGGCSRDKRFAGIKSNLHQSQQSIPRGSIKFSANNFVTQSSDSFYKHYETLELLGEGAYGEVYVCRHRETGIQRAVKILQVESDKEARSVQREFNILRDIDHPNLLKIYQLYEEEGTDTFYIVSDLYQGGELYDEIEEWGSFAEEDAAAIMNQVLSCINYCHTNGICHRDLKPENILLADDEMHLDDIKIIDFGLARKFDDYSKATFRDQVGSSYYMAPEVLNRKYGPKCDVWSAGVVAFMLLCGEAPFDGDSIEEIMEAINIGEYSFDHPDFENVSDDALDFVQWLLIYNAYERPTAAEALKHPWLEQARKNSSKELKKRKKANQAAKYLGNLQDFHADSKLKQVTCAFIGSQLVTKQEKDIIDEMFRMMDKDCKGELSIEDLKYGFKEILRKEISDDEAEDIFHRVNYSASGRLQYSEFLVASIELDEARLRAAFKDFGKGADFLTAADLEEAISMKEGSGAVVEKIMDQIDTNHDGHIAFDEFKTAMASSPPLVSPSGRYTFSGIFTATSSSRRRSSSGRRPSIRRTSRIERELDDLKAFSELTKIDTKIDTATPKQVAVPDQPNPRSKGIDGMLQSLRSALFQQKKPMDIQTKQDCSPPPSIANGRAGSPHRATAAQ
ncbi:MAP kinase-activated protein kinase 2 (Fragment) [Seminavis robusta]|uniref:non-specific serine/threonine protein kinase n=1 Tax=Seminavis robusta TaxID=568900 RepID=A0A9N8ETV5_9STRA